MNSSRLPDHLWESMYEYESSKPVKAIDFDTVHLKLMPYGVSGSGKTTFAYSACNDPRTSPVLGIDLGGNPLSIRKRVTTRPSIVKLDKIAEIDPIFEFFFYDQKAETPFGRYLAKNGLLPSEPFKTLIVDGIYGVQRKIAAQLTGTEDPKPGSSFPNLQIQNHLTLQQTISNFTQMLYDLPMHVTITALEEPISEHTDMIRPYLWGKSANDVPSYSYTIMRMMNRTRVNEKTMQVLAKGDAADLDEMKKSDVIGILRGGSNYIAKDQHSSGLSYMVNPTISEYLDAVIEGNS